MTDAVADDVRRAVEALRRGEVVAYPTETFYGLGVDARSEAALERLRALKGRGDDKAISVLVSGPEMAAALAAEVPARARRLMARHWPGPLTLALPARDDLPRAIVADGFVAVRESPHPAARALVAAFGGPITTTSANAAGAPPATTAAAAATWLAGRAIVLDGGATPGGAPSTIARVHADGRFEILRAGAVGLEAESDVDAES